MSRQPATKAEFDPLLAFTSEREQAQAKVRRRLAKSVAVGGVAMMGAGVWVERDRVALLLARTAGAAAAAVVQRVEPRRVPEAIRPAAPEPARPREPVAIRAHTAALQPAPPPQPVKARARVKTVPPRANPPAARVPAAVAPAAEAEAPAPSGLLDVRAPFRVQIQQEGRFIAASGNPIRLPGGLHNLEFANAELEYLEARLVHVEPDGLTTVELNPPWGELSIDATPGAEVIIDGHPSGQTPLPTVALPLGTHFVLLRHPRHGERRETVTVRVERAARLTIDMTRPP